MDGDRGMEAARGELRAALALAGEAHAAAARAVTALEGASRSLEPSSAEGPARPPLDPVRAAHRIGQPSKIERDPELAAFVLARVDRLTFKALAAEVAAAFPCERHVSVSGLHRWWHRHIAASRRTGP